MTYSPTTNGRDSGALAQSGAPDAADGYVFRAPRYGDLVSCPYCDAESQHHCDWCGGEGHLFASEVIHADQ